MTDTPNTTNDDGSNCSIIVTDVRLTKLGNAISAAIYKALRDGIEADAAASVAVAVAADYWLDQNYARPVTALVNILVAKANRNA